MCTNHSILRANERTRYNGRAAVRFIENGIERGKTAECYKHDERKYLESIAYDNCIAKAYNGFCLIVTNDGVCVTIYSLPEWFGKKRYYLGKERIRNAKHYTIACSSLI